MAEWLKAHAWKACIPQGIQGSNPCLSATPVHLVLNVMGPSYRLLGSYCGCEQVSVGEHGSPLRERPV